MTLIQPGGSALASVPVAVYLEPFATGFGYQPQLLTQGTTSAQGTYSFSLVNNALAQTEAAKTESYKVNALVIAVNQAQTWRVDWNTALPAAAGETHAETIKANISQSPSEGSQIAAHQVSFDEPPCNDPSCPLGPASAESEWNGSWGDFSSNQDEALQAGAGDGRLEKLTKTTVQSLSSGMTGTYYYQEGRDTRVQVAFKICAAGNCGNWQIGGMMTEVRSRNDSYSRTTSGIFHRIWRMEYQYRRYRRCAATAPHGTCTQWKRIWKPYGWTWGKDWTHSYVTPPRQDGNWVRLYQGDNYTRQSGDGETFGAGVSMFGLSLNSEADHSRITKLHWTTNGTCSTGRKYLYGEFNPPGVAKTVNAQTTC